MIRKIIDDEMWLEGERRGCAVTRDDPVVREKVCAVVLRIGAQLRESLTRASATVPAVITATPSRVATLDDHHAAA